MNEDKLEQEAEKIAAVIGPVFKKLEDDLIKAAEGLAFRLKQAIHSVHHAEIDAQVSAAQQSMASALDRAQSTLATGDAPTPAPTTPIADQSTAPQPVSAASAPEAKGDDESLHAQDDGSV